MNLSVLQTQLQLPYRHESWRALLRELFHGLELFLQPHAPELHTAAERAVATAVRQFGAVTLSDGKRIALCEVDVVSGDTVQLLRNRVGLRQLVARCFVDQVTAHAVLAIFVQPGQRAYRLTFAARESAFNPDTLALETHETASRRFTYVLGDGEPRRTAAIRLAGLAQKGAAATLGDVTAAFDVEPVSREFFTRYKEHYAKFCEHLLQSDAPAAVFHLDLAGKEGKQLDRALKPVRDFVKKLLGRLVFLHFLQKKGWLGCDATRTDWTGGTADFLHQLFDSTPAAEMDRFHSTRLVPLFFDTLNNPAASATSSPLPAPACRI